MNIKEQLEQIADEELCQECRKPLTDEEHEMGYVCSECIQGWMDEAVPSY